MDFGGDIGVSESVIVIVIIVVVVGRAVCCVCCVGDWCVEKYLSQNISDSI